jgi:anti-anti-sigma regulatory factor
LRTIVHFDDTPPLLRCSGDEDRTTQSLRRRAFSQALISPANLTVDLSELAFADTTLMLDLAMVARRLRAAGREMYVRGAQPHIRRLIEMVGLHRLPGVIVEGGPAGAWAS